MKKTVINILAVATFLLFSLLVPTGTFGAKAVKITHAISIYSDNGGENLKPLKQPEGVACNDESLFIVADSGNGRLLQFTIQDGDIKAAAEFRSPQLSYPTKVLLNSRGDIYTLDGKHNRIVHLGPDGTFKGIIEPKGLPSPAAFVPKSFDIDKNDNIYILDIFSERVLVLNPEGEYQKQIKFPGEYGFFSDLSTDFRESILLIDSIGAQVFIAFKNSEVFSPLTGSLKEHMRFPANLTTDNRGRIYLVDRNSSLIIFIGQDGSFLGTASNMGWKDGLLNYPSQMCINNKGEIFIADTNNNRIQIFRLVK
jgi:hypothetical protein